MTPEERHAAFRELGSKLEGRDLAVYKTFKRDPDEPIIGAGDANARIALFGRDPGREEVKEGVPFVGAGGQKVRVELHRALHPGVEYDFDAGMEAGKHVFWGNTVPYKPTGNKAWPAKVIKSFQPLMLDVLANSWRGTDVITLGDGAFKWFGLQSRELRDAVEAHWDKADRFETSVEIPLGTRTVRIHPLPHPSPLNAAWYPKFPGMLAARLRQLDFKLSGWKVEG